MPQSVVTENHHGSLGAGCTDNYRRGYGAQDGTSSPLSVGQPQYNVYMCAGCGGPIEDRYYLLAADQQWHTECLQCCVCKVALDNELTCFSKDGGIYCKEHYFRSVENFEVFQASIKLVFSSFRRYVLFLFKTLTPKALWLGTFLNPPKSISALLETCPYLQNVPCIFVDVSYLALMACTSCQVVILPHLERWKYQFPTVLNFSKKWPLEDVEEFGVDRVFVKLHV